MSDPSRDTRRVQDAQVLRERLSRVAGFGIEGPSAVQAAEELETIAGDVDAFLHAEVDTGRSAESS